MEWEEVNEILGRAVTTEFSSNVYQKYIDVRLAKDFAYKIAEYIKQLEAENKELKEWILVSERLPEFDKPVMVTFEDYPESVHLLCIQDVGPEVWLWCEYKFGNINDPSNYEAEGEYNPVKWKYLPQPPKEEGD